MNIVRGFGWGRSRELSLETHLGRVLAGFRLSEEFSVGFTWGLGSVGLTGWPARTGEGMLCTQVQGSEDDVLCDPGQVRELLYVPVLQMQAPR